MFTSYVHLRRIFQCFNSTMDQCFCLRNKMGVAVLLKQTVFFVFVLKVNTNGCRKSALRVPIFHCAVSNRHVYITVWWKKINLCYKIYWDWQSVIIKAVCEFCCPPNVVSGCVIHELKGLHWREILTLICSSP